MTRASTTGSQPWGIVVTSTPGESNYIITAGGRARATEAVEAVRQWGSVGQVSHPPPTQAFVPVIPDSYFYFEDIEV